jgi:hypothetical protein
MKATIPYSEKSHTTAAAAVQFNRVHPPRMTRLALAGFVGAADKRLVLENYQNKRNIKSIQ